MIALFSPVTVPLEDTSVPVPPALPTAVTCAPSLRFEALPVFTVFRFEAFCSCSTATSAVVL
ncbi:MAG: hypothetical protein AUG91_01030 [Actinobacteria bacterium 13_1_20CM_4_69_9]|nr:MAG: hypothetical protein AUG91_01030 [Actinobacteria bacterium 13_1_20CM_4_69_9]